MTPFTTPYPGSPPPTRFAAEVSRQLYSPEAAQQILHVAIARQAQAGESEQLTRAQLLEIAEEMGISAAELQLAEQEWQLQQGRNLERQEFDQIRQGRFQRRVTRYLIVNGFLAALALLATGGTSLLWTPYLALGWGMLLALNGWNTHSLKGDRYEDALQRWRRKRQLKRSVTSLMNRWLRG